MPRSLVSSTSRRRALDGALLLLLVACGGGGGGGDGPSVPPPPPRVLSVDRDLLAATATTFVVTGSDLPGAVGDPVGIRLVASDGLPLADCGSAETTIAGLRTSATTVEGTTTPFALSRVVSARVTLELAGGDATSATAIATIVGAADDAIDQDLDGVVDACDPKTYTFDGEALGARPAGTTPLDGPGQPALEIVDRSGDGAAAFTGAGSPTAYERFDRARADVPLQPTTVYADLDPSGGSVNLELGNEGSLAGYAGGSIIVQVAPSGQIACYERQANQILRFVAGPSLPVSGRLRLRFAPGDGTTGVVHVDARVGSAWQDDLVLYTVPDVRPYRGLAVAASNYYGGSRAIRRLTVARAIPDVPFTLAKAPDRAMDRQVFPRGPDGTAAIPLRLLLRLPSGGTAEAAIVRSANGAEFEGFAFADHVFALPARPTARVDVTVSGVPTGGNYDVLVRVKDATGAFVAQEALLDVAVGDVYVAAGQSNMSGYSGNLVGVDEPTPLAHLFHNDGTWKAAREPMDDGAQQTDWISLEQPLSSCLVAFANELTARTGVPVGIVPTSLGGTNLFGQWQRYAPFAAHRATLYGSMIHRTRAACGTGAPRGLLWFQGESDALSNRTGAQYATDLAQLVSSARTDLGAPDLVVLCGQLGTYDAANQPYWIGVQDAQRRVVAADAKAALMTAVDLSKSDSIHFDVAGYRTMGVRFARAARRLVFGHAVDATNDLVSIASSAEATSATLAFERPVVGGSAALFRATDAAGDVPVTGFSGAGATVTVTFGRAIGADGRLAYGYSNASTEAWISDAIDGSPVPLFDGVPIP